jgi:ribosomal protein S18 acetylase RimI-like enzyme
VNDTVTVHSYQGARAVAQLDAILPVYEQVYAEPPYFEGPQDVAEFLDHFGQQARRPGFRLVTAQSGGEVIGFAFGYLLPANTQWWAGLQKPLAAEFTSETGNRTFAIIELAVRAPYRRLGVGTRLHAALLDRLTAERVTLTVRPEPQVAPARRAYAAWGYRKVGEIRPWEGAPLYNSMVLDLGN